MQIIKSTIKQNKNYEINDSTSINIALVILNILKLQIKYVVVKKKFEKNCLLYGFGTETPESLPFLFINKNNSHTYNQLHTIALSNIYYYWIKHIGLLSL